MTLAIHEIAGLTEAEIKLAIEESAERRETALDTKLAEHRDEMDKRLVRTEDVVNGNGVRLADLQASVAVVTEANARQTSMLETIVKQGADWHTDDLQFRTDVLTRVGKIETDQVTLTTEVRRLRFVGWVFLGVGKSTRFVYSKLCDIGLWKIIITALFLWLLHLLSPVLYDLAMKLVEK